MNVDFMATKLLLPTLRERKRYLAFEVLVEKEVSWNFIKGVILNAVKEYVGIDGLARAGLLFVKNNKNKGILRTTHTSLNKIKAALILIKEINNQRVIVRSISASGMLNKAMKYVV